MHTLYLSYVCVQKRWMLVRVVIHVCGKYFTRACLLSTNFERVCTLKIILREI